MAFVEYNPNPSEKRVGDCVIRALTAALDSDWITVYLGLCIDGLKMHDMPSANAVWNEYLRENGFRRFVIPDTCPVCYSVRQFCEEHPHGVFVLATGTHTVCAIDGNYYDTWDSGDEVPVYYWRADDGI